MPNKLSGWEQGRVPFYFCLSVYRADVFSIELLWWLEMKLGMGRHKQEFSLSNLPTWNSSFN